MNEEIILNYIHKLLELEKVRMNCVNLGMNKTTEQECEIIMCGSSIDYIKKLMKERKIKIW